MKKLLASLICIFSIISASAIKIERVEPLSWWIGMNTPLQLMIYGEDLSGASVVSESKDLIIRSVTTVENPNYLFVDVEISPTTKAAVYNFIIEKDGEKSTIPYTLESRRSDAAAFNSISSADAIYLLMPDRFAKGELPDGLEKIEGKVDRKEPNARHGGNLQGMIDNLDYIADLGMTAIWSTPLLEDRESVSYHGYAMSDLYRVDPRYGTNEMYREYVEAAHNHGLKIIMDMVPNHIGFRHWMMSDLPSKDWINNKAEYVQTRYAQTSQMDPNASQLDFINNRDGWFVRSMPDMNLRNNMVLKYLTQNAIWWVEYANLDAIRVDTYPYNDKYKSAEWTRNIKDEFPGISLMGECWVNEPSFVSYWEGGNSNRDGFDSQLPMVMDFPLQQRMIAAATKKGAVGWDEGAMAIYFILAQDFLYSRPEDLLIFASNHDTDRIAWTLEGNTKKQMLLYSLLATMRGVPQLYYGDEVLLKGNSSHGHGSFREDFPGGWAGDEKNAFEGRGLTAAQDSMLNHTKTLFHWRKTSDAVTNGKMIHFFPESEENQYVYGRYTDDELVFTVLNFNEKATPIKWSKYMELFEGREAVGTNIISGKQVKVGQEFILEPYESLILEIKSEFNH